MPLRDFVPVHADEDFHSGPAANNYRRFRDSMSDFYPVWHGALERSGIHTEENWEDELLRITAGFRRNLEGHTLTENPAYTAFPEIQAISERDGTFVSETASMLAHMEREEAVPENMRADFQRLVRFSQELLRRSNETRRAILWSENVPNQAARIDTTPEWGNVEDRYRRYFGIWNGDSQMNDANYERFPALESNYLSAGTSAFPTKAIWGLMSTLQYIWGETPEGWPLYSEEDPSHSVLGVFNGNDGTDSGYLYHMLEDAGIDPNSFAEFAEELRAANLRQRIREGNYDEGVMRFGVWREADQEAVLQAVDGLRPFIRDGGQIPAWYDGGQLSENPTEPERAWREASRQLRDGINFLPENVKEVLLANFDRTFDKLFDQNQLRQEGRSVLDHIFVNGQNMGAVMDSRYSYRSDEAEKLAKMEVVARILEGEPVDIAVRTADGTVKTVPLRTDAYNPAVRQRLESFRQREQELRAGLDPEQERRDFQAQMGREPRRRSGAALNVDTIGHRLPENYRATFAVRGPRGNLYTKRVEQMIELSATGSRDRLDDRLRDAGVIYFDEMMTHLPLSNLEQKILGGQGRLCEEMGYRFPVEAYYIDGRPIGEIVAEKYRDQLGRNNPDHDIRSSGNFEAYAKAEVAAALLSGRHFVNVAQPRVDANGSFEVDVCDVEADLRPLDGHEGMFRSRRSKLAEERLKKDPGREERRGRIREAASARLASAVTRTLSQREPYRQAAAKLDLPGMDVREQYFTAEEREAMARHRSPLGTFSDGRLPAELERSNFAAVSRLAQMKLMKDHPEVRLTDLTDPTRFAAEKREAGRAVWAALDRAMSSQQFDDLAGILRDSMEAVIGLDYGKELRHALNQPADLPWEDLDKRMRGRDRPTASALMKGFTDLAITAKQAIKGMNGGRFISMAYGLNPADMEDTRTVTDPRTNETRKEKVPGVYGALDRLTTPDTVREFERKIVEMEGLLAENKWFKERQGRLESVDTDYSAKDKYEAIARRLVMEKNRITLLSGNGRAKEIPRADSAVVDYLRDQLMSTEKLFKESEGGKGPISARDAGRYLLHTASLDEIDQGIRLVPGTLVDDLVERAFGHGAAQEWENRKDAVRGQIHGLAGITEGERDAALISFAPDLVKDKEQYNSLLRIYMMAEKGMTFEQAVNVNGEVKNQIGREFQEALAGHIYNGEATTPGAREYYGAMFRKALDKMADYDMGRGNLDPSNDFSVVRHMEALETFSQTAKDLAAMKARVSSDPSFLRGYVQDSGSDLFRCEKGLAIMGNYADTLMALGEGINDNKVRGRILPELQQNATLFKNKGSSARSLAAHLTEEQLDRGARDLKGLVTDLSRTRRPISELTQGDRIPQQRNRRQDDALSRNRQNTNQTVL